VGAAGVAAFASALAGALSSLLAGLASTLGAAAGAAGAAGALAGSAAKAVAANRPAIRVAIVFILELPLSLYYVQKLLYTYTINARVNDLVDMHLPKRNPPLKRVLVRFGDEVFPTSESLWFRQLEQTAHRWLQR
jgi:hypothetical protein